MNPNPQGVKAFTAGATIAPYTIVKFSASGTVIPAAASTDSIIGVSRGLLTANVGDRVDVILDGIADVVCGGTVTRGGKVMSDASGNALDLTSTNRQLGIALESGVSGDRIPVLLKQN